MLKQLKYEIKDYIVEDLTKKVPLKFLPDKTIAEIDFFVMFGKFPNLNNPKTFNEKIQWLKLYGGLEKYSDYADKIKVRKIVEKKAGKKYLVPLVGIWEKFDDINFEKLPDKFVLKANHGSAYNFICKNKSQVDKKELKKKFDHWLSQSFYERLREIQYKNIKPGIICEKYLEDESGSLKDYKILCFNGKPKFIEVHVDRFTNHRTAWMNSDWKRVNIKVRREGSPRIKTPPKPQNLKEMLSLARKLSHDFSFARIDLYNVNGRVYFGEITFNPANGLFELYPTSADFKLGKLLKLPKNNT